MINDVFIASLDREAGYLWSKSFGDEADQKLNGVAIDPSGNIVVTGNTEGYIDFGGGNLMPLGTTDLFVAKFDGDGEHLESALFGNENANGWEIAIDGAGDVLLTGGFSGSLDIGQSTLDHTSQTAFVAQIDI